MGETPLQSEEIDFLRKNKCKIALMLDNLSEVKVSSSDGSDDAIKAIAAATALGVPANNKKVIFANIHADWSINHNWMISFAQTLSSGGYIPGFIGNTDSSLNFNFDRQYSHYIEATQNQKNFNALLGATEPKIYCEPEEWKPYCPSALQPEDIQLWKTDSIIFDASVVDILYAKKLHILNHFWGG